MEQIKRIYIEEALSKKGESIKLAGWVHDFRDLGKLKFIQLRDHTGIVQITAKKGVVKDSILEKMEVNREDVVEIIGKVVESNIAKSGIEIIPQQFNILNKIRKKLPVDPLGVVKSELDTRLDYRYVDLRRKETALIFKVKSIAARAFREKLEELKFIEIHPSAITGAATEGGADVFPVQYFENKAYLVQSPQLYKQMAVIGGFDRVTMMMPVFRAEKHNTTSHLNEITQMDIEMGFADHHEVMDVLEKTLIHILKKVKEKVGEEVKTVFGKEITVPEKIKRYTYTELIDKLNDHEFEIKHGWDFTREAEKKLEEVLKEEAYFIYDWPTEIRAFYSMPSKEDPNICHAFDLIYRGLEISSGAMRIHIPELLEEQLKKRGLNPADFEFYINAFRLGAPPHSGWSIGLERLVMKICNQTNIRECMLFPRDRTRLMP